MTAMSNLSSDVAANTTVVESAVTLPGGLKAALDAAIASGDPAAIASGDPAAIQAVADRLGSDTPSPRRRGRREHPRRPPPEPTA